MKSQFLQTLKITDRQVESVVQEVHERYNAKSGIHLVVKDLNYSYMH